MAETCSEPNLLANRMPGISLHALRLGKRADVCHERAVRCSRKNHLAVDDVPHGRLLSPLHGDDKESRLCRHRFVPLSVKWGWYGRNRHRQEREIKAES